MTVEKTSGALGENMDFELSYHGPELTDGSIAVRDLVSAVTGISESFARIASEYGNLPTYTLRVRDIQPGSVEIFFRIVEFAKDNPAATAALGAIGVPAVAGASNAISGLYKVVVDIAKLINAKKELKGSRVATQPATFSDGSVTVSLPDGLLELTKEQYELLLSRRVDSSLSKLVAPLSLGHIQEVELRRRGDTLAKVSLSEKGSFDYSEPVAGESREEPSIEGTLNSLSKSNLRGTFHTNDGVHVPYHYAGGDIGQLLRGFSSREAVRVHGKVKYAADNIPTFIEITSIEALQQRLIQ